MTLSFFPQTAEADTRQPGSSITQAEPSGCSAPMMAVVGNGLREQIALDELTFGGDWAAQMGRERLGSVG